MRCSTLTRPPGALTGAEIDVDRDRRSVMPLCVPRRCRGESLGGGEAEEVAGLVEGVQAPPVEEGVVLVQPAGGLLLGTGLLFALLLSVIALLRPKPSARRCA